MAQDAPATPTFELPTGTTTQGVWTAPDGSALRYTAEASWTALRDEHDEPVADVFSASYLADGDDTRPVTFVFNGGPGASSAYLHVGALGPRRVGFDEQGAPLAPPTALVDNAESWLAFTDLVFVDPVGTGWSRAVHPPRATAATAHPTPRRSSGSTRTSTPSSR